MKKVFSKEKFIEVEGIDSYEETFENGESWVEECEGKTEKEIRELGYQTEEGWMIEIKDEPKVKNNKADLDLKVNVDSEGLEDTVDILKEAASLLPNITIRNNEQVYVTINYFNTPAKEYYKED